MFTQSVPNYEVCELPDSVLGGGKTVLIVEDHALVRDSLRRLVGSVLSSECGAVEIIEASTLQAAKKTITELHGNVDLVLLDLDLPDAQATDSIACLRSEWQGLPVAVVSATEDWKLVVEFMRLGALGFLPKRCNVSIMTHALRLIFAGGRYFPDEVLNSLDGEVANLHRIENIGDQSLEEVDFEGVAGLSPRQNEVLALVLDGMSNKEIARYLGLSLGTTKNYVAAILHVMGVSSRAKIARVVASRNSVGEGKGE